MGDSFDQDAELDVAELGTGGEGGGADLAKAQSVRHKALGYTLAL